MFFSEGDDLDECTFRKCETMKRILVAGGAGFIGSSLCERLINEGHHVLCVDNLYTGKKANIAALLNHEHFEFIEHDITTPIHLEVDEIYNLACPASPVQYQKDPLYTIHISYQGTLNLLDLARQHKATFLMASTSEVYGDPHVHPQRETYWGNVNPIGPRACYDEGKRISETLTINYRKTHHVNTKIVRIFNTYGHHMDTLDGRVVSNFIVQALKGEPLTLYGDGSQTRSFCHVEDMVDGLMKMMQSDASLEGPINLGNPGEYTVKEIAEIILEKTGSPSALDFYPLPQDDPIKRKPDITLAKKHLDWEPRIALSEGLDRTIIYFKTQLKN